MTLLKKAHIRHLVEAAHIITRCNQFVMIGTGAVIAVTKVPPAAIMQTREIDIYAIDAEDPDDVADLIEGTLGEGSQFDKKYGYYADAVSPSTACLPEEWQARAMILKIEAFPVLSVICPSPSDIALAKLCAWRDKDIGWLKVVLQHGIADLGEMQERAHDIRNANAPGRTVVAERLSILGPYARQKL